MENNSRNQTLEAHVIKVSVDLKDPVYRAFMDEAAIVVMRQVIGTWDWSNMSPEQLAAKSYDIAEAMCAERQHRSEKREKGNDGRSCIDVMGPRAYPEYR